MLVGSRSRPLRARRRSDHRSAECDVPWYPHIDIVDWMAARSRISARTRSISGIRCERLQSDLSISSRSAIVFEALNAALEKHLPSMSAGIEACRKKAAAGGQGASATALRKKRAAHRTRSRRNISAIASAKPSAPML